VLPSTSPGADPARPAIILVRHGETEWSRLGRHTGHTDIPLTPAGEEQARLTGRTIKALLGTDRPSLVVSSPRLRALLTAKLAGFSPDEITDDAAEWDYGDYEGLTSAQIQKTVPNWSIWSHGPSGGEDASAVTARIDRFLSRMSVHYPLAPVLVFTHGHASRCIAARWLDEPVSAGRHYWLGTGGVSCLGYEHQRRVIQRWNLDSTVLSSRE
jgi:probable phosphoglycerate mutase